MKLFTEPPVSLPQLAEELQLVIRIEEDQTPQIYVQEDSPMPDRHLLLGIVQSVNVAVEEKDHDMVRFTGPCTVRLETTGDTKIFESGIIIARDCRGAIAALVIGDAAEGRRLARRGLRWFTGTIRLDVP
jgi:hypothetical protein